MRGFSGRHRREPEDPREPGRLFRRPRRRPLPLILRILLGLVAAVVVFYLIVLITAWV